MKGGENLLLDSLRGRGKETEGRISAPLSGGLWAFSELK